MSLVLLEMAQLSLEAASDQLRALGMENELAHTNIWVALQHVKDEIEDGAALRASHAELLGVCTTSRPILDRGGCALTVQKLDAALANAKKVKT